MAEIVTVSGDDCEDLTAFKHYSAPLFHTHGRRLQRTPDWVSGSRVHAVHFFTLAALGELFASKWLWTLFRTSINFATFRKKTGLLMLHLGGRQTNEVLQVSSESAGSIGAVEGRT